MVRTLTIAALAVFSLAQLAARADEVRYIEKDGVKYQEIVRSVQRPINETRYEPREYTAYNERFTTDLQESQRTYVVPVTQQQWVPGYQRTWNVFAPPVLSYRLLPVTRMETRTETVRIPVTRRELIPTKQVQHVPVTTQRLAVEEHVSRIPVGMAGSGSAPLVATRNDTLGGTKLESDPPKTGTSDYRGGLETRRP